MSEGVQYPWAYEDNEDWTWHSASLVDVYLSDARLLFCPICHERLFLRRGAVRAAHFVHFSESEIPCFLTDHNLLQALILRQFRLCVLYGRSFEFHIVSSREGFFFPLSALGNEMKREYVLVDCTRSDLVTFGSGKSFIIEIVDSHMMSSATVDAYRRNGSPVLQLNVADYSDFLSGRLLPERLDVVHFLNLDPNECRCSNCLFPATLL